MATSSLRQYLKGFPLLVRMKRYVWMPFSELARMRRRLWRRWFDPTRGRGTTQLNVLRAFPQFRPYSAGSYEDKSNIAIQTINRTFPSLSSFASSLLRRQSLEIKPIQKFPQSSDELDAAAQIKELLDGYGSDKAAQDYHNLYGPILKDREAITGVLEIGIGTNNTDVVSNMGMNGKPGASLRAFRDYLSNAQVYGADIDKRILFEESRIKTFFVDQRNPDSFEALKQSIPTDLDLIIDDGLHSPDANIATLQFALSKLKTGGWVVIEDIATEAQPIWEVVAALLPANYRSHLLVAEEEMVFAVKRLS